MEKYTEYVYNYNFYTKKFTRFGKTEWTVYYTATSIVCNGKYMRIYNDMEFSYRLRTDGIYSCYSPKEFVRQFFNKEYNCGNVTEVWASKICHWVYTHGKEIKSLMGDTLFLCVNHIDNKEFICTTFPIADSLTQDWYNEYTNTGYNYHCRESKMGVDNNGNNIMSSLVEEYDDNKNIYKVILKAI